MAEQISEQEKALQQIADTLEALPVCHMVLSLEDAAKTIRAQAEEIRLLKEDSHDWDGAYRERNAMREEIERLRSTVRDFQQVVAQLTLRGVTEREIDDWGIGKPRLISPDEIKRKLRSKGLLIEDTSPVAQSKPTRAVGIDKAEVERFINNTELADAYPSVDYICEWLDGHGLLLDNQHKAKSQLEGVIGVNVGQFAEADPLKVVPSDFSLKVHAELAAKHNALVDLVRNHGAQIGHCFDMDRERIAALEQRLSQPAEQVAWPRLPDYLSPSVQAEFERIRAALGVKESE